MSNLKEYFYHGNIKRVVGVFGTLFDSVSIMRGAKQIKVPIEYQNKRRYVVRNDQNQDPAASRVKNVLPRMGFRLTEMAPDPSRRTSPHLKLTNQYIEGAASRSYQYNRVPYNFSFSLDIKTKSTDDMLQLIEQIVTTFDTPISVRVEDNPDLETVSEYKVSISANGVPDINEGTFESEEVIEIEMQFVVEGWLYKRTSIDAVILMSTIRTFDMTSNELLTEDTEVANAIT